MTQYKIYLEYNHTAYSTIVKAETVGLAVLGAIGQSGRPKSVKAWALTRHKGKDLWVECHVSPSFLEAMIHLG